MKKYNFCTDSGAEDLAINLGIKIETLNKIPTLFGFLNGGVDHVHINLSSIFPHMRISVGVDNIGCGGIGVNFRRRLQFELGIIVENHIKDCEGEYYDGGISVSID